MTKFQVYYLTHADDTASNDMNKFLDIHIHPSTCIVDCMAELSIAINSIVALILSHKLVSCFD